MVYPNSKFDVTPDGPLYNVIICENNKKLYDSQADGYIGYDNAEKIIKKIKLKL